MCVVRLAGELRRAMVCDVVCCRHAVEAWRTRPTLGDVPRWTGSVVGDLLKQRHVRLQKGKRLLFFQKVRKIKKCQMNESGEDGKKGGREKEGYDGEGQTMERGRVKEGYDGEGQTMERGREKEGYDGEGQTMERGRVKEGYDGEGRKKKKEKKEGKGKGSAKRSHMSDTPFFASSIAPSHT